VARPVSKPLMIFDGDCNFCRRWISRWQESTGDCVDYIPLQAPRVGEEFPELSREGLEAAVHLIEPSGAVWRGADAVFRALACRRRWPLWMYQNVPGAAWFCDRAYRLVARHRAFFSFFTRLFWGQHVERPTYYLVRWLFVRLVGIVYLIAFFSLWSQITGLVGRNGIVPADETMRLAQQNTAPLGLDRFHAQPTLCWFSTEDSFLRGQCLFGMAVSLLVVFGIAPGPCLFLLWIVYLSLTTIGDVFLGFQWDNLLLETGFLAIFFAPLRPWPNLKRELAPSRVALWLLRWLLFRLIFMSGCVKLLSGDATWRDLTALIFHYETQPLPTWVAWYAHQLPGSFQKAACVAMFGMEFLAPFLILLPRRGRLVAFWLIVLLQIGIAITGNYTFFNLLTVVLCVPLLDDFAVVRFFPQLLQRGCGEAQAWSRVKPRQVLRLLRRGVVSAVAIVILIVTTIQMAGMFRVQPRWPSAMIDLYRWAVPLRTVNSYGLFAVMTTSRPEILVEGSHDGRDWKTYQFKHKPGDLQRRPSFVAPHQPRLDWQMWFAALGSYRDNPWFVTFCVRLLQGTPEVTALLDHNPFPGRPPKYIRASLYDYHFTTWEERRKDGAWWRREFKGPYCPPLSLNQTGAQ
jgi:lipase maturation factor 1